MHRGMQALHARAGEESCVCNAGNRSVWTEHEHTSLLPWGMEVDAGDRTRAA